MQVSYSILIRYLIVVIIAICINPHPQSYGSQLIVVIDAGHGGNDRGVMGQNGIFEKTITLELSKMIAQKLEGKCQTFLTRNKDEHIDIVERTAMANRMKADIFISIHTGASFTQKAGAISIFYFDNTSEPEQNTLKSWDDLWRQHQSASSKLARHIRDGLLSHTELIEILIQGAPIKVIKGADMPAVLVEIGNLTNPLQEKGLSDPKILSKLAAGIAAGINKIH